MRLKCCSLPRGMFERWHVVPESLTALLHLVHADIAIVSSRCTSRPRYGLLRAHCFAPPLLLANTLTTCMMLRLRPCIIGTDGVCWPTCASPSLISVRHIASSLRDLAGTALPAWLQPVSGGRFVYCPSAFAHTSGWCAFTVNNMRPPARMSCDTPSRLQYLLHLLDVCGWFLAF